MDADFDFLGTWICSAPINKRQRCEEGISARPTRTIINTVYWLRWYTFKDMITGSGNSKLSRTYFFLVVIKRN